MVSSIDLGEYCPFAHLLHTSFFPESSHHRISQFLTQMKKNADSVLWTERKFQRANGIGRCTPVFVNNECWIYFCSRLRKHPSYSEHNFDGKSSLRSFRTFYHDLSSQAVPLATIIFHVEAETTDQFQCLRELFGTGYGYRVRRPRGTQQSGTAILSATERIKAIDYLSTGSDNGFVDEQEEAQLDAPKISNRVVFNYNSVTSCLSERYYYREMQVSSERGQSLLLAINHRLAVVSENMMAIVDGSTFYFEGAMHRTLPPFVHMIYMRTENMMDRTIRKFLT